MRGVRRLAAHCLVIEAANTLFRIGRWAGTDAAQRTHGTKFALQVYAKTTDQYGRESDSLILIIAIDPAKFAVINNFDAERLLNLVEIEQLWPAAQKAVIEFCRDGSRASLVSSFCAQAARS